MGRGLGPQRYQLQTKMSPLAVRKRCLLLLVHVYLLLSPPPRALLDLDLLKIRCLEPPLVYLLPPPAPLVTMTLIVQYPPSHQFLQVAPRLIFLPQAPLSPQLPVALTLELVQIEFPR